MFVLSNDNEGLWIPQLHRMGLQGGLLYRAGGQTAQDFAACHVPNTSGFRLVTEGSECTEVRISSD